MSKIKITKQLGKEFWFQTLLALGWGLYSVPIGPNFDWIMFLQNFVPALFLISWFTGQFVRVKRQIGVEQRLEALLAKLEEQMVNLVGYATGGSAYPTVVPVLSNNGIDCLVMNDCEFPVFDVAIRYLDFDEEYVIDPGNPFQDFGHIVRIGDLHAHKATNRPVMSFNMDNRSQLRVNFFISSRSTQSTNELWVARKEDGRLSIAQKVTVEGKVVEEKIPDDFPELGDGAEGLFTRHSLKLNTPDGQRIGRVEN